MDRGARHALESKVDELAPGVRHWDRLGTALYQLEPSWITAVACVCCYHVALIPSLPKVPKLTWTCSACGVLIPLEPPPEVLAAQKILLA